MGSEEGASWEKPVHRVEVGEFWIGKRPVSNGEFRAFQPQHRSPGGDGDQAPVTSVGWQAAQDYCRWLSRKTGDPYRLATEAEWEKAARGGLEGKKYPWGDEPPVPQDKLKDESFRPAERPNAYGRPANFMPILPSVAKLIDSGNVYGDGELSAPRGEYTTKAYSMNGHCGVALWQAIATLAKASDDGFTMAAVLDAAMPLARKANARIDHMTKCLIGVVSDCRAFGLVVTDKLSLKESTLIRVVDIDSANFHKLILPPAEVLAAARKQYGSFKAA